MPSRFFRKRLVSCYSSKGLGRPFIVLALAIAFSFPGINSTSILTASSCYAQVTPATQPQQPDLDSAMKYHSSLLQRPSPGYLYDRFYNTWLDTSSPESLKQFLVDRANSPTAEAADRVLLAFFYAKQSNDVDALRQLQLALKINPDNNASTLYQMAIVEARMLELDSALENLRKAADANPTAEQAIKFAQLRGKLLIQDNQVDEAAKVWGDLIRQNPNDFGLMEDLIELQVSEGMFKQAEVLSDTLIAKTEDPFQKVIRTLRKGDILQRGGNQAKALEVYDKTLAQVGMNTWIERELVGQIEQVFRREDDLIGLNKHLVKLIDANRSRVLIRKTQAAVLMELGKFDEAIAAYEKIIQLTPGSRENREAFIDLLTRANKNDRAIKQMEALIAQHVEDAELQVQLAELCQKSSKPNEAKAALDRFISLSDDSEYSYLRAARLFEKFDDLDSAKDAYRTALEKFQDSDSLKEAWADFLFRSGSKDEAIKVWQELAKGTDRSGLVRLARLVSVRKKSQVALDMLLARYDDFKLDSIYLGQLCNEAIALKKFPQAVGWATERLRLAKTSSDVDAALQIATLIVVEAKQSEAVIQRLRDNAGRSAVETCLLVELLERSSLRDEAETTLRTSFEASKAAKADQDTQTLAKQWVRLAQGRRDWKGAVKAARELLDLPGGRTSPNVRQLIQLYGRVNDDKAALQWIPEWKRLSPGSSVPWSSEAMLLEQVGNMGESILVLRQASRKFPNDADLLSQLAKKYIQAGRATEAQQIFWRQYRDSDKLADKIRWAGELATVAEIDPLVQSFETRRRNNPQSIEPLLSLAQVYRVVGDTKKQREALQQAARLKKDSLPLLMEVATLEEAVGDWEKAIQTLERASKIDKTNQTKHKIATIYFDYGDAEEAVGWLQKIASEANSTADDIEKLAVPMVRNNNWEELLAFLAPNVVRFPDNYRIRYLVAVANEELGNNDVAESQFFNLLQVNQDAPIANVRPNPRNNGTLTYLDQALPPSAIDLKRLLTETPRYAYSYRESAGAYHRINGGSVRHPSFTSGMLLPSDLEACRDYSLSHLCELALVSPEEDVKKLQGKLERLGIENAKLLLANVNAAKAFVDPVLLIDIDPDNEAALAFAASSDVKTTFRKSIV